MNKKTKMLRVKYSMKNIFSDFEKFLTVETVSDSPIKLQVDGDSLEIGQSIQLLNEDGSLTALDDSYNGQHEVMADSKKYLITIESGILVDVAEVIEEIPVSDEEMEKITQTVETTTDKAKDEAIEAIKKELDIIKSKFSKIEKANSDLLELLKEITTETFTKATEEQKKVIEVLPKNEDDKYVKLAQIIRANQKK